MSDGASGASPPRQRTLWVALALITLLGGALRLYGVAAQTPTADDAGVAVTALNYAGHGQPDPIESFHPVLRNLLEWVSIRVLGSGVVGLKGWSLLLGILTIPLLGMLVYRLTRNVTMSAVSAGLLAVDLVHIDFSRQAIQETEVAFFMLAGALFVAHALATADMRRWRWLLPGAGLAFGLALATKDYAVGPLWVSFGLLGWTAWRKRRWDAVAFVFVTLAMLPFLVYFLTYLPWFGRGYSLGEWVTYQGATFQAMQMHTRPAVGTLANNKAVAWFLEPWLPYVDLTEPAGGVSRMIIAVGNPFVWLAVLPATVYSLLRRRRRRAHQFLQLYFWSAYLPLVVVSRPIWLLSSVAVIPFAFAILGIALVEVSRRWGARVVWAYSAAVVVVSLALYPLVAGYASNVPYLQPIVRAVAAEAAQDGR